MAKNLITRNRAPNYTKQDQLLLIECMKPYMNIIESKQTDKIKQCDKQMAWGKITEIFNANTVGQARTTENLISCFRNIKSKIKKDHSEAKMLLADPVQRRALIQAVEEDGKDWTKVASTSSWGDPQLCAKGYDELKKEADQDDKKRKKIIMGTGGGPHPPDQDEFAQIKKILEPQVDGVFTNYDNDHDIMLQYQATLPEDQRVVPIEANLIECATSSQLLTDNKENENFNTPKLNRMEILRKKKEPALCQKETTSRKKSNTLQDSFKHLSEAKLELVEIQKQIAERDLHYKELIQQIELEDLRKENEFKEKRREAELEFNKKMREKELELMEIKIRKANDS